MNDILEVRMDLETVNKWISEYDGNYSLFYQKFKNRLSAYSDERDSAFFGEFMFFENKYLSIKKHMLENQVIGEIVDIGCQFGFQSEFFVDCPSYTGIDVFEHQFFNTEKEHINYVVGNFPKVGVSLENKVVFSIMSLGYFNGYIDEEEKKSLEVLVEALKDVKHLYISTTNELFNSLLPFFDTIENILPSYCMGQQYHTFYMGKRGDRSSYPREVSEEEKLVEGNSDELDELLSKKNM